MFYFQHLFLCLPTATLNSGLYDAQTGDSRVPEEVQRQKETQGVKMLEVVSDSSTVSASSAADVYRLVDMNPSVLFKCLASKISLLPQSPSPLIKAPFQAWNISIQ